MYPPASQQPPYPTAQHPPVASNYVTPVAQQPLQSVVQEQPIKAPAVARPMILAQPVSQQNKHEDYTGLSILTCLCCCWPLGLAALIYSCMADSAYAEGRYTDAQENSNWAKNLNISAVLIGFILWIAIVASAA